MAKQEYLGCGINNISRMGVRIYEDFNCVEDTGKPVRKHAARKGMKESYHKRVQKKWLKRWGTIKRPCMFKTNYGYICHPALAAELRKMLAGYSELKCHK